MFLVTMHAGTSLRTSVRHRTSKMKASVDKEEKRRVEGTHEIPTPRNCSFSPKKGVPLAHRKKTVPQV